MFSNQPVGPPPPLLLLRFLYVRQLPVTIDAAFVEFMHTQSLELRVWRGDRADWPTDGNPCGVAKVVLRSLLTTLGGVGGDLTIAQETGGSGDRAGSIAARLFFKHRGLGPTGVADPEKETGQPVVASSSDGEKEVVVAAEGEVQGVGRRRSPVSFREEVEVLGEGRSAPSNRTNRDLAARRDGAGMATTTTTMAAAADRAPVAESAESPRKRPRGRAREGGDEEPEGSNKHQRQPQGSGPASPSGGNSELRVHVERAMRLAAVSAAPSSGEAMAEAAGGALSPGTRLPSTYVTFRWEEEGKPPLRSPLLLLSGPSTSSEAAGVAEGSEEKREVNIVFDCQSPVTLVVE